METPHWMIKWASKSSLHFQFCYLITHPKQSPLLLLWITGEKDKLLHTNPHTCPPSSVCFLWHGFCAFSALRVSLLFNLMYLFLWKYCYLCKVRKSSAKCHQSLAPPCEWVYYHSKESLSLVKTHKDLGTLGNLQRESKYSKAGKKPGGGSQAKVSFV